MASGIREARLANVRRYQRQLVTAYAIGYRLGPFDETTAYSGERDRSFRVSVTAAQRVVLRA